MGSRFLVLLAGLAGLLAAAPTPASTVRDRADVERVEDLVEDFANSLHALSRTIRERDLEKFATHFADDVRASGLPPMDGPPVPYAPWVERVPTGSAATGLGRAELVEEWGAHLAAFTSIEDVRIKIKKADVISGVPPRADAKIKFYWLGRNAQGRREWVKGQGEASAWRAGPERWILDRFEITELSVKVAPRDLFSEVSAPTGTSHRVPDWGDPGNDVFLSHGAAVADVNADGLLDLFVTGHHENFLYVNRGDGTFENRAGEALVGVTPLATGALFLDHDNDGDPDLFLSAAGNQMLFENRMTPDGTLRFEEISERAGVSRPAEGYSAVSADVNSDGFPDVYVCSYNKYGQVMPNSWSDATNGTPNLLFLNRGDGTFDEVAEAWGCSDSRWTYAAQFGDLNGDGRPDLYLANDFGKNELYLNEGSRFRSAAEELGLVDTGNGMGVSFADFNNDGRFDVHVTNMSSTAGNRILGMVFPDSRSTPEYARTLEKIAAGNTLFLGQEDGTFRDVTKEMGPFSAGWAFGGGFVDFDNDGWEDLHSPNGFISGKDLKDT